MGRAGPMPITPGMGGMAPGIIGMPIGIWPGIGGMAPVLWFQTCPPAGLPYGRACPCIPQHIRSLPRITISVQQSPQ